MERLNFLVWLGAICAASTLAAVLDPRGARPVEQGTRSDKCATEKEWPFCTDDQWGPKCPSGCRIQGLMDRYEHSALKRVEKIRSLLDRHRAKHRSTDLVTKQTYDYLKEKLTSDAGNDNSYYDLAQSLRQRISDMKIKIDRQLSILRALKQRVGDQVVEMQRLEVDIDIKLRSCKGSCQSYTTFEVDHESYVGLEKQVNQLDSQSAQNIESVGTLYVMKSRPLKDSVVDSPFKSKDVEGGTQRQNMFPDVPMVELKLEHEGSVSSPATISKVVDTSYSSTSKGSSSSSIIDLGGDFSNMGAGGAGGHGQPSKGHMSTTTVSCTRSVRRTVVHTKDGPVEKMVEVMEGGPGCEAMTDSTKGGMNSFFPGFTSSSSSSSSSSSFSTKTTSHSGGTKGSILDIESDLGNPFGDDLGLFKTSDVEDDLPDFQARSVKSTRTERHADHVGKDCVNAQQHHLKGEANGLFKIKPSGADGGVVEVYCRQEGLMGGWLLVQQRESGALDFNRSWAEYRVGFGSVDAAGRGEFWIGNRNLHLLTSGGETLLKVELEDWEGGAATADYTAAVGPEGEGFPLSVSGYLGDAGDGLTPTHAGTKFSTFDRDNDAWGGSCAEVNGGGWWYNSCQSANLNGAYHHPPHRGEGGVVWATYKPADYSLKAVRMFIRPASF
ncbi:fibrinogen alpha chain-like [Pungitius pungitius]|uniref:fibrinogen alpha chain-like n=1 Tax=Pungitius pungitius TaxID=134920 RepID=UPI002E1223A5